MASKKNEGPTVLVHSTPSFEWRKRDDYKKVNRSWLKKSVNVALRILDILEEKEMNQTELAVRLNVSRQQVSKILKGQENLTIETISKLETALGIKLGRVLDGEDDVTQGSAKLRISVK